MAGGGGFVTRGWEEKCWLASFQLFAVFAFASATVLAHFFSPPRTAHTQARGHTTHKHTRTDGRMRPENRAGFCSANRWSEVKGEGGRSWLIFANTQNHTFSIASSGWKPRENRTTSTPSTGGPHEVWPDGGGGGGPGGPFANVAGHARTHTTHTTHTHARWWEMHRFLRDHVPRGPRKHTGAPLTRVQR